MEQQHKKPAVNSAASSPANSGSSSSSCSFHGSMSSAFFGVSSSTHSQSQRHSSVSLCLPPEPAPLPGVVASRGFAATGGSASGLSSFQFHQISPSPGMGAACRPRPSSSVTHSLPSPFHSGLSMRGDTKGVGVGRQTLEAMPTPSSMCKKVNNAGSNCSSSSIPWNSHGSIPMYPRSEEQALQQLSILMSLWSSTVSSSSDQSMASIVSGSCHGWAAVPALANKLAMMSIGGSSSSVGPQTPCNYSSLSVENSTPVPAMQKLILGGMDRPGLQTQSPALEAGASSSLPRRGCTKEHFFSQADMEKISKDNRLKELMKTEPKRVRRIVRNRGNVARLKVQKANHMQDLERQADALKMECTSLSAQVQLHREMVDSLKTGNRELQIKLKGLNEQANLSQALNDQLQSEIERLKPL